MINLESQQAYWARECCKGGNCPICNPLEEENYPSWQEDKDMEDYYERKNNGHA